MNFQILQTAVLKHPIFNSAPKRTLKDVLKDAGGCDATERSNCDQPFVRNLGKTQCLVEAEAKASVDVPYPLIVNSVDFCLYLYPLSAPFLNPLSSPSHLSLLINSLSS